MENTKLVISIIIPCFNDGHFLLEALESAQAVPGSQHEIIVVNDGSTDLATLSVLDEIEKQGVKVIHQANKGLGSARNRGISEARGRYILTLDADNKISADYISRSVEVLDAGSAVDVVYADAEYFGERTGTWSVGEFNLRRLLSDNYIDACAVFRRFAWERCGGYDECMPIQGREDWDLWVRIAMSGGKFFHIARPLFFYRVRANSMTSTMIKSSGHQDLVRRYIYSRRVEMSIGEYAEPHYSLGFVIDLVRHRPVRTLVVLLIRAFWPSLLAALPPPRQPNDRQLQMRDTDNAKS